MSRSPENVYDPALVVADACRIALAAMPLHLRPILTLLANATGSFVEGAQHAKYEQHALVRAYFGDCREQLQVALGLLAEVELAPDPDFDAEPA